jgi:large subunit ribosomal protein L20
MSRVKRGVTASKRRKKVIKAAKGYKWRRKSNYRAAKEAVIKAGKYAFRDRRTKKRVMRRLWITRLNNAVREYGTKYSAFIKVLKTKKIDLDRKVLSELAMENPDVFKRFMESVKK